MDYRFTTKLFKRVCRMCGAGFSESWSEGGIGATCEACSDKRMNMDLLRVGLIRNIKPVVETTSGEPNHTYTFESLIDGKWYECHRPMGDWSYVKDDSGAIFSVPVGFWELQELYERHTTFRYYRHNKSYRKLLRHERIEEGAMQSWCHGELQAIVNADGETVGGTPADFSDERDFYNPM